MQETWKGIRRRLGVAQDQKQPIGAREIRLMVDELPTGIQGFRDRALVTLGFAGGFRRSELVALDVSDLTFVTAVRTARKQGKNVLDFLVGSITAHIDGTTAPRLLGTSALA